MFAAQTHSFTDSCIIFMFFKSFMVKQAVLCVLSALCGEKRFCTRGVQNGGSPRCGSGQARQARQARQVMKTECRNSVQNVQNGEVVALSVPDGGTKYLSQSESSTPDTFCTWLSPATAGSKMLFENLIKSETLCAQRLSKVSESGLK